MSSLVKLTIKAFSDPGRHASVGDFAALFNPKSYRRTYQVQYAKTQGINTSGKAQTYSLTPPGELQFTLMLDGTVNNLPGPQQSVDQEITLLLDLAKNINGTIHQPNYLTVNWGDLSYGCRLKSLDINYSLFNGAGKRLRAELAIVFVEDVPDQERLAKEHKQSPDLTHSRLIKAGDQLFLIAEEIYGDPGYYLPLACYNQLNHCGALTIGSTLVCPPLDALIEHQTQAQAQTQTGAQR